MLGTNIYLSIYLSYHHVEGELLLYRILTLLNYGKHYTTSNFTIAINETQHC
jgi:hypothetical protein